MALIGDDYPVRWKNLPLNGTVDDWGCIRDNVHRLWQIV